MTQFSAVLRAGLEEIGKTQDELAGAMEKGTQATVSRLMKGESLPRKDMLRDLCRQFPRHLRAALVAAYVSDVLPESEAELLTIGIVKEGEETPEQYRINRAVPGSALRRNLDIIERHAIYDIDAAIMVEHLAAILDRGNAQHPGNEGEKPISLREDPAFRAALEEGGETSDKPKKRGRGGPKKL